MENIYFENIGVDLIDTSGSQIEITHKMNNVSDKSLSIGEKALKKRWN